MTQLPTVKEVIADQEDMRLKITGRNKFSDTDPLEFTYYEGKLSEISENLMDAEVLSVGYSYGSKCPVISVPYMFSERP